MTPSIQNPFLQAALQYAARGWDVFPCKPRSKVPLIKWKDGATQDTVQMHAWWARWPEANVAIATGLRSGIAVIDLDSLEGFKAFSAAFPDLLDTYVVQTGRAGGGLHLYFQLTRAQRSIKSTGVELKADGSYVLAPPSIHDKTGQPYTVLRHA